MEFLRFTKKKVDAHCVSGAHPAALPMKAVPTSHHYANTLAAERDLLQQQQNRLSPSSPHQDAIATLTRPLAEGP